MIHFEFQNTDLSTGAISYLIQTGVNSNNVAVYSLCNQYGQLLLNTCSGTIVTNSDGTKSCSVKYATASNGYPIYEVNESIQSSTSNHLYNYIWFV